MCGDAGPEKEIDRGHDEAKEPMAKIQGLGMGHKNLGTGCDLDFVLDTASPCWPLTVWRDGMQLVSRTRAPWHAYLGMSIQFKMRC